MLKIVAIVLLTGLTACVHSEDAVDLQSRSVTTAAIAKPAVASSVRAPSATRMARAPAGKSCKGIECRKRVGMLLGVSY